MVWQNEDATGTGLPATTERTTATTSGQTSGPVSGACRRLERQSAASHAHIGSLTGQVRSGRGERTSRCQPSRYMASPSAPARSAIAEGPHMTRPARSNKHTYTHTNIQTYEVQGAGKTNLCLLWNTLENKLDGCPINGPQEGRCSGLNLSHPRAAESKQALAVQPARCGTKRSPLTCVTRHARKQPQWDLCLLLGCIDLVCRVSKVRHACTPCTQPMCQARVIPRAQPMRR